MSYTPTTWAAGDTVTAAKLNKLEQGVAAGGGVLVVHEEFGGVLDKTWQEIYDAGLSVMFFNDSRRRCVAYCASVNTKSQSWDVVYAYVEPDGTIYANTYTADSADGYPVYVDA